MTAEIVNLRRARKARGRAEAEAKAAQNRIDFGRSKAERTLTQARDDLAARRLDGHRREPGSGDEGEA
jgi:hypothetical protein